MFASMIKSSLKCATDVKKQMAFSEQKFLEASRISNLSGPLLHFCDQQGELTMLKYIIQRKMSSFDSVYHLTVLFRS